MMVTNKLNRSIFARVCDSFSRKKEVAFQMIWNVTDGFTPSPCEPVVLSADKNGEPEL